MVVSERDNFAFLRETLRPGNCDVMEVWWWEDPIYQRLSEDRPLPLFSFLLHPMSSFSCLRGLLSAFRTLELERAPKAWFANSVQSTGFTHQVEVSPETQHWTPPSVDKSYIPLRTFPPSNQHLSYPKTILNHKHYYLDTPNHAGSLWQTSP